jgi:hypothetical protein
MVMKMRLGWTTSNYTTTYRAIKTIRVNGKNQTKIIKTFGSEKYICETYGVTDAKAWAKEQVRLMNEAEKEDAATFTIELNSGTDLVIDEQRGPWVVTKPIKVPSNTTVIIDDHVKFIRKSGVFPEGAPIFDTTGSTNAVIRVGTKVVDRF